MSFLRSKRGAAAVAAVVIVALFLIRPGADQLRTRIARAISLAIGRQVEISSVTIQLLPRPGFNLQNFVVHEDPAFGVEPTLRASEVTAALRLTSLLRGRLEIARLSLTEPSVNLVRNSAGRWNLENVLQRADQTHAAPTAKNTTEARRGFPYIEASVARINFKFGQEKKPYTLTDADFSLWQDSENAWGMRLRAQPVRTDFNLSDTGTIRIQGSWQRAQNLRDTPLQFHVQWDQSQLGQASTLWYGSDQGWRGTVSLSLALTGTAADLAIHGTASVDDFRRYDLDGGGSMRLAADCSAHYAPADHALSAISCQAPVAGGFIALSGAASGFDNSLSYDLHFAAQHVPMQSVVAFARHTKKNIPEDLAATGTLDTAFHFERENEPRRPRITWTGQGETSNFGVGSALTGTDLFLDKIPFSVSPGVISGHRVLPHGPPVWDNILAGPHLEVGPFKLSLGRPAPVTISALASPSEYGLSVQGDAGVRRLLQLARSVGLPAAQPNGDGIAKVDLQSAGSWSAFSSVTTLGQAQLHAVRAEVRGLNEPLEIGSANVVLLPGGVEVNDITASLAGSTWHGSLALPRQCGVPVPCLVRFNLHADSISTDDWSDLLTAHSRSGPWYRLFESTAQPGNSYLLALHASGQISANRVMIHKLPAARVTAKVELQNGVLRLSELEGNVFGGSHKGEWTADFTAKPPTYSGAGTFLGVDLEQLGQAMHDGWITGTGTATYHATTSGLAAAELTASADARLQVDELEGTLPHIVLNSDLGPLSVRGFTGLVLLRHGNFEVTEGDLETADGPYQMSGTASLGGVLDLKLTRDHGESFTIVGPLTAPNVATAIAAEARANPKL